MPKNVNDLSSLISSGRARRGVPANRAEVLVSLLRKRAVAWRGGMVDLEARLRNQILWSLPVEKPEDRETGDAKDDAPTPPAAA